jgi:hypothetical protein
MAFEVVQRTVALLDILGFEESVLEFDLSELAARLDKVLAVDTPMAVSHGEFDVVGVGGPVPPLWGAAKCGHLEFSDTVFLYSLDATFAGCVNLITSCWFLLRSMFADRFPCRGAISFGELAVDTEKNLFLGRSIIEAYRLATGQDWCGTVVAPSVEREFPSLHQEATSGQHMLSSILLPYRVPFKAGARALPGETLDTRRKYLCINWRFNLMVKEGVRWLFGRPSDAEAQRKIRNTLAFCRAVRKRGKDWSQSPRFVPDHSRHVVGFMGPPLVHGDEY